MKRKWEGFTLIELLAVIVILAVIVLIAVPIVGNVITEVRVGAFQVSAANIARSAEHEYMREMYNKNDTRRLEFYYEEKEETSNKENVKLNYKGDKPDYGAVLVNGKGRVSVTLYNSKYKLCAYKAYNEDEVKVERNVTKENCDENISRPKIEIIGSTPLVLEIIIGETYTLGNEDYIAYTSEGEITNNVEIYVDGVLGNIIDRSILNKEYEAIYKVIDGELFKEIKRTIKIIDTTPPVIEVPESTSIKVSEVLSYNLREGVTVTDNSGEEIEFEVLSGLSRTPGSHEVKYTAEDSSGNKTEVIRIIDVADDEAPVITIIGDNPMLINVGETYTELGATAIDEVDGDLTSNIITSGNVNTNVVGTYFITYKVCDSEGNEGVSTREVRVIDNIPPTITIEPNGHASYAKSRTIKITVSDVHSSINVSSLRYGFGISKTEEPSLTETYVNGGNIQTPSGISGEYYLWVVAEDSKGNIRKVVSEKYMLDNTPPVITIPGNVTIKTSEVLSYNLSAGVSVTDNSGESITASVSGSLVGIPGNYTITYTATDSSGNTSVRTRIITVVDQSAPVITLNGSNPMNINVGSTYTEPGATAVDDVDGNLTSSITITGTVTTSTPGTYTRTYRVTDSSGNVGQATRTVNVVDNIAPTVVYGTNGNSTYGKTYSTKVTVSDNVGVNTSSLKYIWNTSTTAPSEATFTTSFTNAGTLSTPGGVSGDYYLWILAKDTTGNRAIVRSNVFRLDNTLPVVTSVVSGASNITTNSFTITRSGNASDAHSGLATNPYIYQTSTNGSTWTTRCTNNSTSCNVTGLSDDTTYYYRICTNDVVGNQNCTASKSIRTNKIVAESFQSIATTSLLSSTDKIETTGMAVMNDGSVYVTYEGGTRTGTWRQMTGISGVKSIAVTSVLSINNKIETTAMAVMNDGSVYVTYEGGTRSGSWSRMTGISDVKSVSLTTILNVNNKIETTAMAVTTDGSVYVTYEGGTRTGSWSKMTGISGAKSVAVTSVLSINNKIETTGMAVMNDGSIYVTYEGGTRSGSWSKMTGISGVKAVAISDVLSSTGRMETTAMAIKEDESIYVTYEGGTRSGKWDMMTGMLDVHSIELTTVLSINNKIETTAMAVGDDGSVYVTYEGGTRSGIWRQMTGISGVK